VRPEAEVWIIWGDGSSAYSLAEFDTFTRHRIPVIGLIGNDACCSQILLLVNQIRRDWYAGTTINFQLSTIHCFLSYRALPEKQLIVKS
jgi:thiamine pyrophosphate-dependent acetolactate synthase large subunit-like protein